MIIRDIEADDLPVCLEYLKDEWGTVTGSSKGADKVALKMERAMTGEIGKVVMDGNRLVGFTVLEEYDSAFMIISFYISKEYRTSKANYLMMDWVMDMAGDKKLLYIPLHKDMSLPTTVCKNGKVDKDRVSKWLDKTEDRYKE